MNYKVIIYVISTLLSAFVISGINFNNVFKKNKLLEAKLFIILLSLSLSYLVSNFIISFLEVSKIVS